jgi:hypothetical protein
MTPDFPLPLVERNGEPAEASIAAHSKLLAEGWVRRHLADPARTRESIELYTSMGYEVKTLKLTPSDLGPMCGLCALDVCKSCVLIYTRRKERVGLRDTPLG